MRHWSVSERRAPWSWPPSMRGRPYYTAGDDGQSLTLRYRLCVDAAWDGNRLHEWRRRNKKRMEQELKTGKRIGERSNIGIRTMKKMKEYEVEAGGTG